MTCVFIIALALLDCQISSFVDERHLIVLTKNAAYNMYIYYNDVPYVIVNGYKQAQYSVTTAIGLFKSVISSIFVVMSYYLADRFAGYRIF